MYNGFPFLRDFLLQWIFLFYEVFPSGGISFLKGFPLIPIPRPAPDAWEGSLRPLSGRRRFANGSSASLCDALDVGISCLCANQGRKNADSHTAVRERCLGIR